MLGKLGDMAGMLKKAREMQANMGKAQEELSTMEVSSVSDCGNVEVRVACDMRVTNVLIKNKCAATADQEIIAGAVLNAVNKALDDAKLKAKEKMSELTGGLDIPGLAS
ncbi:MAG: YbaB/EbfC family nucleoid-associated protein [Victivallales bacterium]|nr:YbaB/EbfC family nucleoid-associated protein [Victivallales bacterium]